MTNLTIKWCVARLAERNTKDVWEAYSATNLRTYSSKYEKLGEMIELRRMRTDEVYF